MPADDRTGSKGGKGGKGGKDDERDGLAEGVEHLQTAAKEIIRATRSLLDAAEGLVEDPSALQDLLGTLGSLASAAAGRLRAEAESAGHAKGDADDGRVHPIKLS